MQEAADRSVESWLKLLNCVALDLGLSSGGDRVRIGDSSSRCVLVVLVKLVKLAVFCWRKSGGRKKGKRGAREKCGSGVHFNQQLALLACSADYAARACVSSALLARFDASRLFGRAGWQAAYSAPAARSGGCRWPVAGRGGVERSRRTLWVPISRIAKPTCWVADSRRGGVSVHTVLERTACVWLYSATVSRCLFAVCGPRDSVVEWAVG